MMLALRIRMNIVQYVRKCLKTCKDSGVWRIHMAKEKKYRTRTETAIKEALMALLASKPLAEISVAELAREAHVSRSTFYEHYGNPNDVYDELTGDMAGEMSPLMSQVTCKDGFKAAGTPFCEMVRGAGSYAPIVGDARFIDTLLDRQVATEGHDLFGLLVDAGYTREQAEAVCSFQMSGCFNAARKARATDSDWSQIRPVIDRFILGGIAACLAAKKA